MIKSFPGSSDDVAQRSAILLVPSHKRLLQEQNMLMQHCWQRHTMHTCSVSVQHQPDGFGAEPHAQGLGVGPSAFPRTSKDSELSRRQRDLEALVESQIAVLPLQISYRCRHSSRERFRAVASAPVLGAAAAQGSPATDMMDSATTAGPRPTRGTLQLGGTASAFSKGSTFRVRQAK